MKIYIGGIPFDAKQADLMAFVEQKVGAIADIAWIVNKNNGHFRGFCFVQFSKDSDDAFKAMVELKDAEFQGRKLICNEARPRPSRPRY